ARLQQVIVSIDRERDLPGPTFDAIPELTRCFESKVARRWGKEHEADHIRTGIEGHIERLERLETADLDEQRHGRGSTTGRRHLSSPDCRGGPIGGSN